MPDDRQSVLPSFSLKGLLWGTTLIAVGLTYLAILFRHQPMNSVLLVLFLWIGGGALIAAGLLMPFGKVWAGAIFGGVLQALLIFVLAVGAGIR
jgi:hypothetical protein